MPTTTINMPATGDSTTKAQSRTVTIPGMVAIDSVSVNTGNVTYSNNGADVTVNVDGGTPSRTVENTPSKTVTDYKDGSSNSSSSYPSTTTYDDGTYKGTLVQSGTPTLISGSAPITAKKQKSISANITDTWMYQQTGGSAPVSATKTDTKSCNATQSYIYSKTGGSAPVSKTQTDTRSCTVSQQYQYAQTGGSAPVSTTKTSTKPCTVSSGWKYQQTGGSATSKTVYTSYSCNITWYWNWDGTRWNEMPSTHDAPSSHDYDDGVYKGTVSIYSYTGSKPSPPSFNGYAGQIYSLTNVGDANYTGTVYANDTRTYGWIRQSTFDDASGFNSYDDGTYKGTLYYVNSIGTPPYPTINNPSVGATTITSVSGTANYSGTVYTADTRTYGWVLYGSKTDNSASSVSYNDGTYSGTLGRSSVSGTPTAPTGTASPGTLQTQTITGTANYTGTVSTADTRTYGWVKDGNTTDDAPATILYNDGTYSGTLSKTGLLSIPPAPTDIPGGGGENAVGNIRSQTAIVTANYSGTCYTADTRTYDWVSKNTVDDAPANIPYDDGTYTGTLSRNGGRRWVPNKPTEIGTVGDTKTTTVTGTVDYAGDCTTADTRLYRQNYSGTAYGATQYTYYYVYVVTVNYTTSQKLGTLKAKVASGTITLPVYDLNTSPNNIRIQTPKGTGCFKLVPTDDPNASPFRVKVPSGILAISK